MAERGNWQQLLMAWDARQTKGAPLPQVELVLGSLSVSGAGVGTQQLQGPPPHPQASSHLSTAKWEHIDHKPMWFGEAACVAPGLLLSLMGDRDVMLMPQNQGPCCSLYSQWEDVHTSESARLWGQRILSSIHKYKHKHVDIQAYTHTLIPTHMWLSAHRWLCTYAYDFQACFCIYTQTYKWIHLAFMYIFILMAYMLMYVQVPYLKDHHDNRTDFTDGLWADETRMGGSVARRKGEDRVEREFRERQLELRDIWGIIWKPSAWKTSSNIEGYPSEVSL